MYLINDVLLAACILFNQRSIIEFLELDPSIIQHLAKLFDLMVVMLILNGVTYIASGAFVGIGM